MQIRPEMVNGTSAAVVAPPLRDGVPVDYGPRADDKRQRASSPASGKVNTSATSPGTTAAPSKTEEAPEGGVPSRHLWVGNVAQELSETTLREKFVKFGELESLTVYPQRNYAFVNYKIQSNAVEAKENLQGLVLGGLPLRIEFAKGAKPSRHLWVGCISPTISKEELEAEFKKFGALEDFKFMRDRNSALVDYIKIEDAISAVEALNGKRFGEEELRVDFGRSQILKRESRPAPHGLERTAAPRVHPGIPDPFRTSQEILRGSFDAFRAPATILQATAPPATQPASAGKGGGKDGDPSEVLWIGFPPNAKFDEETLHRFFIPFGEVERIKTFPGRSYAFVQFRSIREAAMAKTSLSGKLFNGYKISIEFSTSEIGPMDTTRDGSFIPNPPEGHSFPELLLKGGMIGPRSHIVPPRPASPNLRLASAPDIYGLALNQAGRGLALGRGIGSAQNLARGRATDGHFGIDDRLDFSLDGPGIGRGGLGAFLLRSGGGGRLGLGDGWDHTEEDMRESKRSRIGSIPPGGSLIKSPSLLPGFDVQGTGNGGSSLDQAGSFGGPRPPLSHDGDDYGQGLRAHLDSAYTSRVGLKPGYNGEHLDYTSETRMGGATDQWRWQGMIAKGGTPVCRARGLPVGKGIGIDLPEVVNCTARTDLDMLAKHIFQAGEFSVIFFVPEGDNNVPPYQDFLHYLREKHRAGVAKLGDGATLFLVPPSTFSEKVLKVPGNDCLFGVVLKFQHGTTQPEQGRQLPQPPHPPQLYRQQESHQQIPLQQQQGLQQSHPLLDLSANAQQSNMNKLPSSNVNLSSDLLASLASLLPQQVPSITPVSASGPPGYVGGSVSTVGKPPISDPRPTFESLPSWPSSQQDMLRGSQSGAPPNLSSENGVHHPHSQQQVPSGSVGEGQGFSNGQYQQQAKLPSAPHLPTDQLAQLTALLTQSQTPQHHQNPSTWPPLQNAQQTEQVAQQFASQTSQSQWGQPQHGQHQSQSQFQPQGLIGGAMQMQQTANSEDQHGASGQGAEDRKRFQATLQLAAALLQQMQQQNKS